MKEMLLVDECDAALIYTQPNLNYFCGFTGSAGALLLGRSDAFFVTDSRYFEQAEKEVINAENHFGDYDCHTGLLELLAELKPKRLFLEDDRITYAQAIALEPYGIAGMSSEISMLRRTKDADEILDIRRACEITDKGFEHICKFIEPGKSEIQIALELEYYMRAIGAQDIAFKPIVVSGKRSSLVHGAPSNKIIERGDIIILDFGVKSNGYCSDITRTVAVGNIADELKLIYNTCLEAQVRALDMLKAGCTACDVDACAREAISEAGFGSYFGHGLGHGVGLEIHEEPRVNKSSKTVLGSGMIVTIEPGIYIPGVGGVRIEDTCLVLDRGCEALFKARKELIVI